MRNDRGAATAEFAVVLPAVLVVLSLVVGAVLLVTQRLVLTSAAGDMARLEARGDHSSAAARLATLPAGVHVEHSSAGPLLCLSLRSRPGAGPLAALEVTATGCAAMSAQPAAAGSPATERPR